MQFLFHSVITEEGHSTYYNVYKIDDTHFLAECHHFNRVRNCDGDFELQKEGEDWRSDTPEHAFKAQQIGEEIERLSTADGRH